MKRWKARRLMGVPGLFLLLLAIPANGANLEDAQALLRRMESAYEAVKDYQVLVRVAIAADNAGERIEEFVYTLKKPGKIRIEFQTPQPGTILIFPDKEGKVLVRPWGLRFLDHRLAPDSLLLSNPAGQRVDQTDFGLLIRNIGRSLGEGRRGPAEILEGERSIRIRVAAENHFREGKVTKYQFTIDRNTWFPSEIEERTPEGILERRITFRNLTLNTGVPDSFFQP